MTTSVTSDKRRAWVQKAFLVRVSQQPAYGEGVHVTLSKVAVFSTELLCDVTASPTTTGESKVTVCDPINVQFTPSSELYPVKTSPCRFKRSQTGAVKNGPGR